MPRDSSKPRICFNFMATALDNMKNVFEGSAACAMPIR